MSSRVAAAGFVRELVRCLRDSALDGRGEDDATAAGNVSRQIRLKAFANCAFVDPLAIIQATEDFVDDQLGLVALAMQQESVENVLAAHGIVDLFFLVVLAEFGEVDDLVSPAEIALAVDLEHHFLGVAGQGHGEDKRLATSRWQLVYRIDRRTLRKMLRIRAEPQRLLKDWHDVSLVSRQAITGCGTFA